MTRKRFEKLLYRWLSPRDANKVANWMMYSFREDRPYWAKQECEVFNYQETYDELCKEVDNNRYFVCCIEDINRWTQPGGLRRNLHN